MYRISSEERIYDCVKSMRHFEKVRKIWNDHTKIIYTYKWNRKTGNWDLKYCDTQLCEKIMGSIPKAILIFR